MKLIQLFVRIKFIALRFMLIMPLSLSPITVYSTEQAQAAAPTCAPASYADAVSIAAPAVVSIKTTKEIPVALNPLFQDPFFKQFFGDPNEWGGRQGESAELPKEVMQGLGSGVIVSDKGYILTNNHVIKGVDSVVITLADGRIADGKLVGSDPDTDLAVLQIKLDKLPVIQRGSSQKLRVGDIVLAIGNPFGLDKTVTQGIISATERSGTDIGVLENLLQTDAAINPGNSGGALINASGQLVGINTAIYTRNGSNTGLNFAIPIDQATEIMMKIIEGKQIIRRYIGIMMQALNKEIREYLSYKDQEGVYVRAVVQGSPAQKAGLLPGDIILKINNETIVDDRMAFRLIAKLSPGKSYAMEIFRKGEKLLFSIVPTERKTQADEPKPKNKK
jgi:serine protease DegS